MTRVVINVITTLTNIHFMFNTSNLNLLFLRKKNMRKPQIFILLYASTGKEQFYKKERFKKMKTGMALFVNAENMKDKGFTK